MKYTDSLKIILVMNRWLGRTRPDGNDYFSGHQGFSPQLYLKDERPWVLGFSGGKSLP